MKSSQGRSAIDKAPVFGVIERGGKLNTKLVGDATIYSAERLGYNALKRIYDQKFIKHGQCRTYTNTTEGFWGLLKSGIVGIYHFTSVKNLQKYVDKFVLRYSARDNNELDRFVTLLANSGLKSTRQELINV